MQSRIQSLAANIGNWRRKTARRIRGFRDWYGFYRQGQHVVRNLGRWESFCRALEWAMRTKS